MFSALSSRLQHRTPGVIAFKVSLLVVGVVALFMLAQIIGVVFAVAGLMIAGVGDVESFANSSNSGQMVISASVYIVTLLLVYLIMSIRKKPFWEQLQLKRWPAVGHLGVAVGLFLLYLLCSVFVRVFVSQILPGVDLEQQQQLGFDSPVSYEYILVFVALVVLPAFVEEVLFRGFLFGSLRRYIPVRWAAIVTAVVFGAAHLEYLASGPLNWSAAIDTAVLSLFLTYAVVHSKSLWPAILLHGLKNAVAFTFIFVV